jgi:hypothetical protein
MRVARRAAVTTILSTLVMFGTNAYATSCWYPNEIKAAQMRDLHAQLMVGTLHCRAGNPVFESEYNEFVDRRHDVLDGNIAILKDHFQRESGSDGQIAYDRYSTVLANAQASKDYANPDTCAQIGMLLRAATNANDTDLLLLAQTVERAPESNGCPSNAALPAAPAAPAAAFAPAPAVASAPEPVAQATLASVEHVGALPSDTPPTPPAAAEPAKADLAAAPAAITTPAPAPAVASADSRDQAMQAAIAALQAATIALQSVSAAPAATPARLAQSNGKPDVMKQRVPDSPVVPVNGNGAIE